MVRRCVCMLLVRILGVKNLELQLIQGIFDFDQCIYTNATENQICISIDNYTLTLYYTHSYWSKLVKYAEPDELNE